MTDRFAACAALTSILEGSWSDDPVDNGGPTMRGITIRVYAGYVGVKLTTDRSGKKLIQDATYEAMKARLRRITDAEVLDIYRRNYWEPVRAAEMPAGVDFAAWDLALNAGPVQAVKCMQRVLGVTIDGHIGAATMGALKMRNPADLIREYLAERRRFHRSLSAFWRFGKGWLSRCDQVEATALEMAGVGHVADVLATPAPLPDPDAQSASQGRATPTPPAPPAVTELTLATTGILSGAQGFSNGFSKVATMAEPTMWSVALAFLSEPLVFTAVVTLASALTTWLYRRAHQ